MFSALVTARLRPLPDIEIQGGKGLALQLRVRGHETTAQLERAYERYRAAPDTLTSVVDELIQVIARGETQALRGTAAYDEIAPRLFPQFMTARQWSAKREQGLRLVIRPVVQDLGIALVIDRAHEMEYVQIEAIPEWGIDAQQLYETAMQNLARAAAPIETTTNGQGDELLLMDAHTDGYAAARALLPARWRDWRARVAGELILALPARDLMLGFSRAHPAFAALRSQVNEDARTQPHGLFPNLLVVRDNALEILSV